MNHEAIYALYPQVVTIDDGTGAFDKDGNKVEIDLNLMNSWINPEEYKELRKHQLSLESYIPKRYRWEEEENDEGIVRGDEEVILNKFICIFN